MPVSVTGMHRSGTSMIARLLNLCGLDLGPNEHLLPAADDNPEGFWELRPFVAINDKILQRLGGDWHLLATPVPKWETHPDFQPLREQAGGLVAELGLSEPWGWKDPRTALTFAFWQQIWPEMRFVICVRNPLEVALSLLKRDQFPCQKTLYLWLAHYRLLLSRIPPEQRVITHYEAYFHEPEAEVRRLVSLLHLPADEERIRDACAAVRTTLRHSQFTAADVALVDAPDEVREFYGQLCAEGNFADPGPAEAPALTPATRQVLRRYEECAAHQHERVQSLAGSVANFHQQLAAHQYLSELGAILQKQLGQTHSLTAALLEREREAQSESSSVLRERLQRQLAEAEVLTAALATARHERHLLEQRVGELQIRERDLFLENELLSVQLRHCQEMVQLLQVRLSARRHRYADRVVSALRKLKPSRQ